MPITDDIVNDWKDLRKGRERDYSLAVRRITDIAQRKPLNYEESRALLIYLAMEGTMNIRDAEQNRIIVLGAWGLLPQYENDRTLAERRKRVKDEIGYSGKPDSLNHSEETNFKRILFNFAHDLSSKENASQLIDNALAEYYVVDDNGEGHAILPQLPAQADNGAEAAQAEVEPPTAEKTSTLPSSEDDHGSADINAEPTILWHKTGNFGTADDRSESSPAPVAEGDDSGEPVPESTEAEPTETEPTEAESTEEEVNGATEPVIDDDQPSEPAPEPAELVQQTTDSDARQEDSTDRTSADAGGDDSGESVPESTEAEPTEPEPTVAESTEDEVTYTILPVADEDQPSEPAPEPTELVQQTTDANAQQADSTDRTSADAGGDEPGESVPEPSETELTEAEPTETEPTETEPTEDGVKGVIPPVADEDQPSELVPEPTELVQQTTDLAVRQEDSTEYTSTDVPESSDNPSGSDSEISDQEVWDKFRDFKSALLKYQATLDAHSYNHSNKLEDTDNDDYNEDDEDDWYDLVDVSDSEDDQHHKRSEDPWYFYVVCLLLAIIVCFILYVVIIVNDKSIFT